MHWHEFRDIDCTCLYISSLPWSDVLICFFISFKDDDIRTCPLALVLRCGAFLLPCGFQTEPRIPRCHPSSWQTQPKRIRAAASDAASRLWLPRTEKEHPFIRRRSAGVQPRSAACYWAQIPKTRLVQDPTTEANHPRGRLHQSYNY